MPRTTISKINETIREAGVMAKIVYGSGYFWFASDSGAPDGYEIPSVYVCRLRDMTFVEWTKHAIDYHDNFASSQEETLAVQ